MLCNFYGYANKIHIKVYIKFIYLNRNIKLVLGVGLNSEFSKKKKLLLDYVNFNFDKSILD